MFTNNCSNFSHSFHFPHSPLCAAITQALGSDSSVRRPLSAWRLSLYSRSIYIRSPCYKFRIGSLKLFFYSSNPSLPSLSPVIITHHHRSTLLGSLLDVQMRHKSSHIWPRITTWFLEVIYFIRYFPQLKVLNITILIINIAHKNSLSYCFLFFYFSNKNWFKKIFLN